ncbi:MAG: TauD/TfdA family dioxygenase [Hyphomicrobiaceae bacterium]|nr:TauD/TfdA family dioxygenase [Hyphomicrobiaceae bacterium]
MADGAMPITQRIVGRDAWTRADLKESDWRVVLPAEALSEVRSVVQSLREQPVPALALRPDSYQMPACRAAMETVKRIVNTGVKFALVERLPVEEMSEGEAKAIYWMLSSMIARPVAQKLDGTMIYDVTDTGRKPLPGSGVRPDKSNVDLQFHNDNAYNLVMPEVVGLLCIRKARSGGTSRVMSFATAHNRLRERFPERLDRLYQPFVFDRQKEHRPDESPLFEAPVFINDNGTLLARLGQHQIKNGYALAGGMDEETREALLAIDEVFRETDLQFEFDMQPGDMQFARNCEVGHSRTEFHDFEEAEKKRLLVRLWLRDSGKPGYVG